jgi:hypothetical protein
MHYVIYIVVLVVSHWARTLSVTLFLLGDFSFLYQVTTDLGNRGDTRLELIQKIIM